MKHLHFHGAHKAPGRPADLEESQPSRDILPSMLFSSALVDFQTATVE